MSEELQRPEPGDLAVIIKARAPEYVGRIVFCVEWVQEGTVYRTVDGKDRGVVGYRSDIWIDITGSRGQRLMSAREDLLKISPNADQFTDEREGETPEAWGVESGSWWTSVGTTSQ